MVALGTPFKANSYEGLFFKVLSGKYERIPSHYSANLAKVIDSLL